jgi:hypothetical protein
MESALILFLIIMGNLTLYWVFFGKKKFEAKLYQEDTNTPKSPSEVKDLKGSEES